MATHDTPRPFGSALKAALDNAGRSQADLARHLRTDPSRVSRWVHGQAVPYAKTVRTIEEWLGADLSAAFVQSSPDYELYVSAPLTGLAKTDTHEHHDAVEAVVSAARLSVNGVYWPAETAVEPGDLLAADIATERNLKVLSGCESFLYLQFSEMVQPSGALIELGLALGRSCKTTLILLDGLQWPYMLHGLDAVAARLSFMPQARLYVVKSVEEAATLVERNGRGLLGLT